MTEYGIELNVRDRRENIYPKYFGYENLEEAIAALRHFYKLKETNQYMYVSGLGNYWIVGDITLIIR